MTRAVEFFAGMGLMRAGLESIGIETVFANDIDRTKAKLYADNWGREALHVGDIRALKGGRYTGRRRCYCIVSVYGYVTCRKI